MKKGLFFAAVCVTAAVLSRAAIAASPEDIVPRGDISYDLLGSLAASGHVPGATLADLFRGDRLYTRREMAGFIADAITATENQTLLGSTRQQIRSLAMEFAPELQARGVAVPASSRNSDAGFSVLLKARGGAKPVSGDIISRFSLTAPVGRDGYAAVSFGNYRDEWYPVRPLVHDFPTVETLFVRYNTRAVDITVGQLPLRWGPGYSGGLLFSDNSPTVPQLRLEKGFDLPGSLGRRIGKLYFTQVSGEFYEPDVPTAADNARGTKRYLFGRRLETAGDGGPWKLSLSESFKATRLPGAGWAFVLPFYAYQDAFTHEPGKSDHRLLGFLANGHTYPNTQWFNYLVDAQLTYRVIPNRDASVYTDFMVDDIKAPKGLQGFSGRVPRKIGLLVGGNFPRLDSAGRYGLRLEYATLDPNTYGSVSPPVAYDNEGTAIGYPYGGNTHLFFGRFDARVSPKVKAAAEVSVHRRDDSSQPGLSGNRYSLYGNYALRRDQFVGVRLDHITGDEQLGNVKGTDLTRGEVSFGIGF